MIFHIKHVLQGDIETNHFQQLHHHFQELEFLLKHHFMLPLGLVCLQVIQSDHFQTTLSMVVEALNFFFR